MGREVWIYQLNSDKISGKLQPKLSSIQSEKSITIQHQNIIEKITNNTIDAKDLWNIIETLNIFNVDPVYDFSDLGIRLLYQSSTKSIANCLMPLYYDFMDTLELPYIFDSADYYGNKCHQNDFEIFLYYLAHLVHSLYHHPAIGKYIEIQDELRIEASHLGQQYDVQHAISVLTQSKIDLVQSQIFSNLNILKQDKLSLIPEIELMWRPHEIMAIIQSIRKRLLQISSNIIILDAV